MTRETKAGLVVTASFLTLVGIVLVSKLHETGTAAGPEPDIVVVPPADPTPVVAQAAPKAEPGAVKPQGKVTPSALPPLQPAPRSNIQLASAKDDKPAGKDGKDTWLLDATNKGGTPVGEVNLPGREKEPAQQEPTKTPPLGTAGVTKPEEKKPSIYPDVSVGLAPFTLGAGNKSPAGQEKKAAAATEKQPAKDALPATGTPTKTNAVFPPLDAPAVDKTPVPKPADNMAFPPIDLGKVGQPAPKAEPKLDPKLTSSPAPAPDPKLATNPVDRNAPASGVFQMPPPPPPAAGFESRQVVGTVKDPARDKPATTGFNFGNAIPPNNLAQTGPAGGASVPNNPAPGRDMARTETAPEGRVRLGVPATDRPPDNQFAQLRPQTSATNPVRAPAAPPQVDVYDEVTYECRPNDTWRSISVQNYQTDRYERALLYFNRNHPLANENMKLDPPLLPPGQPVYLPPVAVLEKQYGGLLADPQAPVRPAAVPQPLPAQRPITVAGSDKRYRVQPQGEMIRSVAARLLGDGDRWTEIYQLNKDIDPKNPLPGGLELRVPGDARVVPISMP